MPKAYLNHSQLEQFRGYLDMQEANLADAILLSMISEPGNSEKLHLHGSGHFRLSQALQILASKVREMSEEQTNPTEWKTAVTMMNQALWKYAEVLEEGVNELIDQVKHTDLNVWKKDFYDVVAGFKELLAHRIEDFIWLFKRCEEYFLAYKAICKKHKNLWVIFGKFWSRFTHILDKNILDRLFRAEEKLTIYFKEFSSKFDAYIKFEEEAKHSEDRFRSYSCFSELAKEKQDTFLKLVNLISIWEQNSSTEILKNRELVNSIRNIAKVGSITLILKEYFRLIRKKMIQFSNKWQKQSNGSVKSDVIYLKEELNAFEHYVTEYREILIRSDANPHVKTRWGVTHWISGPEPRKTRDLFLLSENLEKTSKWLERLDRAIENGKLEETELKQLALKRQMDSVLHEMGQPLSSRSIIQTKAEHLIELIDMADELGGSYGDVKLLLNDTFLKALRLDTKYQVLHDYPRFDELYEIHQDFFTPINDPGHIERLKHFQQVIRHIEHWLKEKELGAHAQELYIDEATIQESLQKLLGNIQRKEPLKIQKPVRLSSTFTEQEENLSDDYLPFYLQMILEYRYLFSSLFYKLRKDDSEGKALRKDFTFVDHYLDALEETLRKQSDSH